MDDALALVELCYPRRLASAELVGDVRTAFAADALAASSFLPPAFPVPPQASPALASIKVSAQKRKRVVLKIA